MILTFSRRKGKKELFLFLNCSVDICDSWEKSIFTIFNSNSGWWKLHTINSQFTSYYSDGSSNYDKQSKFRSADNWNVNVNKQQNEFMHDNVDGELNGRWEDKASHSRGNSVKTSLVFYEVHCNYSEACSVCSFTRTPFLSKVLKFISLLHVEHNCGKTLKKWVFHSEPEHFRLFHVTRRHKMKLLLVGWWWRQLLFLFIANKANLKLMTTKGMLKSCWWIPCDEAERKVHELRKYFWWFKVEFRSEAETLDPPTMRIPLRFTYFWFFLESHHQTRIKSIIFPSKINTSREDT